MKIKPRYKRRLFWTLVSACGIFIAAIIIVPPLITLNYLKPTIEQSIKSETGIPTKINGDIHFSLLGRATIIARDLVIPQGTVDAIIFSVPLSSIFNIENATFNNDIMIYGANVATDRLTPYDISQEIEINDSYLTFQDNKFEIINATLNAGHLDGTVRLNDTKYNINFNQDIFTITNHNNNLDITGQLYSDGSATGHMSIQTDNINKVFKIPEPQITQELSFTSNFKWDGGTGFLFKDIVSDDWTGSIEFLPDGEKNIKLSSPNVKYDFSFLLNPSRLFYKTNFDLDLKGDLTFANRHFQRIKFAATGAPELLQIKTIIADDFTATGGTIDKDGAKNIMFSMPLENETFMCLFSGTPDNWTCNQFSYGDLTGSIKVEKDTYEIFTESKKPMPTQTKLMDAVKKLGKSGTITFRFSDIAGTAKINKDGEIKTEYTFATNKNLNWLYSDFSFLPKEMLKDTGDFYSENDKVVFNPYSENWSIEISDNNFYIQGNSANVWLGDTDLKSLKDSAYSITGTYNKDNISNLKITIAGNTFTGNVVGNKITLNTELLNLDSFLNDDFMQRYQDMEFLTTNPITLPFSFSYQISLSADKIIYQGNTYNNFVFSLKDNTQKFSITDKSHGNMLAKIIKDKNNYKISITLNKFILNGLLLKNTMPLNIQDSLITAEISLKTSGYTSHDLMYNLYGDIDINLFGGQLTGLGLDKFYTDANSLTAFNTEYKISAALESGTTQIKTANITGEYKDGTFKTTSPFKLDARHVNMTGELDISKNKMTTKMQLILRGTSQSPKAIDLEILPNGARKYSLSKIMTNFDATFMRDFIKTHNKF